MDRVLSLGYSWSKVAGQIHAHVDELESCAFIVAVRPASRQYRDHREIASSIARGREAGLDKSRLPTLAPARRQSGITIKKRDTYLECP